MSQGACRSASQVDAVSWLFASDSELMRALPEVLVVNVGVARWLSPTLGALERYVGGVEPGAELITQRLTEILFVQALAAWLAQDDALQTGWLRALRDPHLQRALGGLHASPARDWSVEALAREAGLSRSAFFSRFRDVVGETPARYLLAWRMTLAARALREEELSVGEVCARVGYGSVPSFTHAFRAHFGQTPAAYRRANQVRDAVR